MKSSSGKLKKEMKQYLLEVSEKINYCNPRYIINADELR